MSFLTDLFTSSAGTLVKDIGDTAKKFITTESDRLAFELEMKNKETEFVDKLIGHADAYEAELTKRQVADMQSDSWLAKNVRPGALIYLLAAYTIFALTDGNINIREFHFVVKPEYVAAFQSFTEYFVMFYAGGRSIEKVTGMITTAINKK